MILDSAETDAPALPSNHPPSGPHSRPKPPEPPEPLRRHLDPKPGIGNFTPHLPVGRSDRIPRLPDGPSGPLASPEPQPELSPGAPAGGAFRAVVNPAL